MGRKNVTTKQYDQKNLQSFSKRLFIIRNNIDNGRTPLRINLECLETAIKGLPEKDRENIEKFWGLTGGTNHSRKLIVRHNDQAYKNMQTAAELSMLKLFELDRVFVYDENLKQMIEFLYNKIKFKRVQVKKLDAIKYLIAFFGILENGPKMTYEEDPLTIDSSFGEHFVLDQYSAILGIYQGLQENPNNSIKLRILIDWIEWMNFEDANIVKKSFGIGLPNVDDLKEVEKTFQQVFKIEGKQIFPSTKQLNEVQIIKRISDARSFKERVFPYGSWEITSELIFDEIRKEQFKEFFEALNSIKCNWSKLENFKTGEKQLKTSAGMRTLAVYEVGGLKFTDPDEIIFLYTERYYITF